MKRLNVSYMPFGGLAGRGQEFHAGAIGALLLLALVGQERTPNHFLGTRDRRGAGVRDAGGVPGCASHDGAGAEQHRDDHLGLGLRQPLTKLGEVAAGQMPGFVRKHADQLVRRFRLQDRAVIDENAPAVGNEGIERAVIDDDHLDVLLLETCDPQDRPRVFAKQLLGLGVAQQRRALALLGPNRRHGHRRAQRKRGCDHGSRQAGGFLAGGKVEQHGGLWRLAFTADTGYALPSRGIRLVWGTGGTPPRGQIWRSK